MAPGGRSTPRWTNVLLALSAFASVAGLGVVLWFARYGFDFTDEGFYLNWMARPWLYDESTTMFGFVYHPMYELTGGDIAVLRWITVALDALLVWGAAYLLVARGIPDAVVGSLTRMGIATALTAGSLILCHRMLVTPSYRTLAFQGLLVVVMGLALIVLDGARRSLRWDSLVGGLLLGVGGCAIFLARPPSALTVGLVVLVTVLVGGRMRVVSLAAGALAAGMLALATALVVDGSVPGFVDRLVGGLERHRVLDAGHEIGNLGRWEPLAPGQSHLLVFVGLAAALTAATHACTRVGARRVGGWIVAAASTAATAAVVALRPGVLGHAASGRALVYLALPVASVLLLMWPRHDLSGTRPASRSTYALACCLLLLPLAGVIGTNGNYWREGAAYAVLWFLAAVLVLAPVVQRSGLAPLTLQVAVVQVLAGAAVLGAVDDPRRQPGPLWADRSEIRVGAGHLLVSGRVQENLAVLRAVGDGAGLEPGTPVIDLTGRSPGRILAMDALPVASPYIIGGFPGSDEAAEYLLARVPCRVVADSWLLSEPDGVREIDPGVMAGVGASVADDYAVTGSADVLGLEAADPPSELLLLRPERPADEAARSCEAVRSGG